MCIAVIGWGSLIWCPGSLRIRTRWHCHGPELRLEFSRISADGRLTLVIDNKNGTPCKTYWAESAEDDLDRAKKNLKERERCNSRDIHSVRVTEVLTGSSRDAVESTIHEWMKSKETIKAAVWTGLPSNWQEAQKRNRQFSPDDAVQYVQERIREQAEARQKLDRLKEYICNAPPQIQTALRNRILAATDWKVSDLPTVLFEDDVKQSQIQSPVTPEPAQLR